MQLPETFISTIKNVYKKDGEKFLAVLPDLIQEASQRWDLTNVQPVPNLSYHFVVFAKRGGEDVVLKMGIPNPELTSEMTALKLFNGDGACRLLESDEERGFLLLERLNPGTVLADLTDDDERTNIAIDVMQKIWREVPSASPAQAAVSSNEKFIKLSDWFDELKTVRPKFDGGMGPFPKEIFERVESFLPELFADTDVKLIHGDFHHFNILKSERGWLAIDPKGVIGPAGYEVGPLMLNPWNSFSDGINFQIKTERRVSILAERLSWEREKIINWATAHAVLSAWWSIEDNMDSYYSILCARIFSEFK